MDRLLLASASPRRRELLAQLDVPFEVVVAEIVEHEDPTMHPREMVSRNAASKAEWVSARHPDAFVLGADTTVYLDGWALNKPAHEQEAREMLRLLAGRVHTVFTGLALRAAGRGLSFDETSTTEVTFKSYDEAVITEYLSRVHVYDKAGGYAIQEHGELLVEGYEGELSNIVGLPLLATRQLLTRAGLLSS